MANLFQPTKAKLDRCTIGDISFAESVGGQIQFNYHVKEFRIYEDICKAYFTGQLVIETMLNTYELLLQPTQEVILKFTCPRSDGGPTRSYQERFRIYSYDSRPIGGGADGRVEHTISLIGQEYYNDKHNVVVQNFKNTTGVSAAQKIHQQYIASNGGLEPSPSVGMIGSDRVPHQVLNKKPFKAIHDILDRCVFSTYQTCAPVYFRRKQGYVMKPLQEILETGPITGSFQHRTAAGSSLQDVFLGYNNVIHMRPLAPPGEDESGTKASDISGMLKSLAYLDVKRGHFKYNIGQLQNLLSLPFVKNTPSLKNAAQEMLAEAQKSSRGGMTMMNFLDTLMQEKNIDKNGPGGYNVKQEAFIAALTYAQKYWVSVPGQTGVNITCGDRINVIYPVGNTPIQKTLFIPRLIHEVRFSQGDDRQPLEVNAKTEIYGVHWP
jgi:hypothetical protein